jgi:hypothetical protein
MHHRKRKPRPPSDAELIAAAHREAEACAARGDFAGARKAMRAEKDVALRAQIARRIHAQLPKHPMQVRQETLVQNAYYAKYSWMRKYMTAVPPHPTRREERAFARLRAKALAALKAPSR